MAEIKHPRDDFDQELPFEIWDTNYKGPEENYVKDTRKRQAVACASIEKSDIRDVIQAEFEWVLDEGRSAGGGRITANLGIMERIGTTLMNCFVNDAYPENGIGVDSMEGIYREIEKAALTLKSEGGYGHNFSYIRPDGMYIKGIGSRTPGVIQYMGLWNETSKVITQGSEKIIGKKHKEEKKKIRKGAMMGALDCSHPQIFDFIDAKLVEGVLDKFNLSVGVLEKFMEVLSRDGDWDLRFPDTTFEKYDDEWNGDIELWEEKGYPVIVTETIKARKLWDKIMLSTYQRNDPGTLQLGLFNKLNPLRYCEKIRVSNPCGEIGMSTGVCNLFSINLTKFYTKEEGFNWKDFKRAIIAAVRFSDNINDISSVPLDEYKKSMTEKRRIGIGTLGIGSLLYMMGVPFNSKEGLNIMKEIAKFKAEQEILASAKLGKEKGSFLLFDKDKYFNTYWWKNLKISEDIKKEVEEIGCMRNSHQSANAPTGNMSIYLGLVSGGIEPVFSTEYVRFATVIEGERAELRKRGFDFPDVFSGEWYETDILKEFKRGNDLMLKGTFEGVEYEIDKGRGLVKKNVVMDYGYKWCKDNLTEDEFKAREDAGVFVTAESMSVDDHLDSLAIFAHYTNMNNSKTINVPNDISYDEFKHIYERAYKLEIKGVTTYRAGTMTAVLETIKEEQDEVAETLDTNEVIADGIKLPEEYITKGYIVRDAHTKKKWYVNVAFASSEKKKPFGLFVTTNHSEGTEITDESVKSLILLAKTSGIKDEHIETLKEKLKHGSNVQKLARTISLLLRHNVAINLITDVLDAGKYPLSSFAFHIKKLLMKFIPDGAEVKGNDSKCSVCGGQIIMSEGCYVCRDCGNSKCG